MVILIGIFAATASPAFINVMRDRRVNRVAMEISGVYRLARSRALGRGTAVLVRWSAASQRFEVREATVQSASGSVLSTSCLGVVDWQDDNETRAVRLLRTDVELAELQFLDEAGAAQTASEMCFTARGRTFVRYSAADPFGQMAGVPRVNVRNEKTGLLRSVLIPPNGVARLAL